MTRRELLRRAGLAALAATVRLPAGRAAPAVAVPVASYLQGIVDRARPGDVIMLPPGVWHLDRPLRVQPGITVDGGRGVVLKGRGPLIAAEGVRALPTVVRNFMLVGGHIEIAT